jgi:hypothetical protein
LNRVFIVLMRKEGKYTMPTLFIEAHGSCPVIKAVAQHRLLPYGRGDGFKTCPPYTYDAVDARQFRHVRSLIP